MLYMLSYVIKYLALLWPINEIISMQKLSTFLNLGKQNLGVFFFIFRYEAILQVIPNLAVLDSVYTIYD